MSCNTPWSNRDAARVLTALALGAALVAAPAAATPVTPASSAATAPAATEGALLPNATVVGEGTLRFFGLSVYRARLLAAPGWRIEALGRAPLVLELNYLRSFKGADIARRSLEEMRRAGPIETADETAWLTAMQRLFPDVQDGDRIAGLWQPGVGARFVFTGADGRRRVLGEVADARFAERFFGIWLAPTTSEPALRQALLGPGATLATR